MTPLSKLCEERIAVIFPPELHHEVTELLEERCGANLPGLAEADNEETFDRIRLAALKLSDGDIARLHHWVARTGEDWRSVVDAAGFGHDGEMHRRWIPRHAA